MAIQECVPKDKFDVEAIERAHSVGFPDLNPLIPELLEFVQDANWPVAVPSSTLLSLAGPEIVPFVRDVLRSDDGMWKYWTIELVVKNLPTGVRAALSADLAQLVDAPAQDDIANEADKAAARILAGMGA